MMLDGEVAAKGIDAAVAEHPHLSTRQRHVQLSHPVAGRSLGTTVARVERPIREAIALLGCSKTVDVAIADTVFAATIYGPGAIRESDELRLAWFVVGAALLHAFATDSKAVGTFYIALEWFVGDADIAQSIVNTFPRREFQAAEDALTRLEVSEDLLDLLPYVLEPHGHITRKTFERSEIAKEIRSAKKNSGVYYTPSDVADFMVRSIVGTASFGTWLDPACGTGVFLRAVQRHLKASGISTADVLSHTIGRIYGIDKSAIATDLACFVFLTECVHGTDSSEPPIVLWRQLKRNVVCMDALRLEPRNSACDLHDNIQLLASLEEIFPSVESRGFDHVVMNPPYTTIRIDKTLRDIWHSFSGLALGAYGDVHLAFGEMLWRFRTAHGSAGAVLPLSVGSNTSKAYLGFRQELTSRAGSKEFLFFDREPQALFGEDIKTRNLILFMQGGTIVDGNLRTSRLLKWTGPQRPSIFTRDRLVSISSNQCREFVPKLGSAVEASSYVFLKSQRTTLRAAVFSPHSSRTTLDQAASADRATPIRSLLVSGTAYNFINCFFPNALPSLPDNAYSKSPINVLTLPQEDDAYAAFALVSSRICFWLWHVEGDGFHLTSKFLTHLPLWAAFDTPTVKAVLSDRGRETWDFAKRHPIASVNGGRQTYSFHCGHTHPAAFEIEHVLLASLGLPPAFSESLDQFIAATVSIDGKSRGRHFQIKNE